MIPQKTFVTLSGSKDTVNSSAGLNAENKTIDIIRALDYHFQQLTTGFEFHFIHVTTFLALLSLFLTVEGVKRQETSFLLLMNDSVLYLTDIWCSSGSGSRHRPRDS